MDLRPVDGMQSVADGWCAVAWGPLAESKMSTKLVLEYLQHHGYRLQILTLAVASTVTKCDEPNVMRSCLDLSLSSSLAICCLSCSTRSPAHLCQMYVEHARL